MVIKPKKSIRLANDTRTGAHSGAIIDRHSHCTSVLFPSSSSHRNLGTARPAHSHFLQWIPTRPSASLCTGVSSLNPAGLTPNQLPHGWCVSRKGPRPAVESRNEANKGRPLPSAFAAHSANLQRQVPNCYVCFLLRSGEVLYTSCSAEVKHSCTCSAYCEASPPI